MLNIRMPKFCVLLYSTTGSEIQKLPVNIPFDKVKGISTMRQVIKKVDKNFALHRSSIHISIDNKIKVTEVYNLQMFRIATAVNPINNIKDKKTAAF